MEMQRAFTGEPGGRPSAVEIAARVNPAAPRCREPCADMPATATVAAASPSGFESPTSGQGLLLDTPVTALPALTLIAVPAAPVAAAANASASGSIRRPNLTQVTEVT
jgi:hypothetical protein